MKTSPLQSHGMPARVAALQMLYALELGGQDAQQVERWYVEAHPLAPPVRERAGALVDAVVSHQAEIERLIGQHAKGWRLERISVIDRSLLKLAAAELLLSKKWSGAAVEAVVRPVQRLAAKFSQPEAVSFVGGLIEAMARDLRHAGAGAPVIGS